MEKVTVEMYRAADGMLFKTEEEAVRHEKGDSIREEIADVTKRLEEIEVIPDSKTKLVPLEEYMAAHGNAQGIKSAIKKNSLRYFMLRDMEDVRLLARYMFLKRSERDMQEESYNEKLSEDDIAESFETDHFPCLSFICDRFRGFDSVYNTLIGTFEGEMGMIKKYCRDNGYEMKTVPVNND